MEKRVKIGKEKPKQNKKNQRENSKTLNVTGQAVLGSAATLHQTLGHGIALGKPTHGAPESPAPCQRGTPANTMTRRVVGQHFNSSVLRASGWFPPRTEYNVPNRWRGWSTSHCVPTSPCHTFYTHNLKGERKYVIVPNYSYYITGIIIIIIAMLLLLNYLDMAWLRRVSMFWQFWRRGPRRARTPVEVNCAAGGTFEFFFSTQKTVLCPAPTCPSSAPSYGGGAVQREKFYICNRSDCFVCTTWVLKIFLTF